MKHLLTFLAILIFFYTNNFSQVGGDECTEAEVFEGAESANSGGLYKPSSTSTNEYFRILIVFVQFKGDGSVGGWTYNQLPDFADKLVDNAVSATYRTMTTSDYWKRMSYPDCNFDFIGDYYENVITIDSQAVFKRNNKRWYDCNKDVIDSINYKIDFKKYENWELKDGEFYFDPRNADGYLDMLYIIYRNPGRDWFGLPGGIATLGISGADTMYDGTIIDRDWISSTASGITISTYDNAYLPALLAGMNHEFGHYLFGSGHTKVSGLMPGAPYSYKGGTFALSGWERVWLGYSNFTTVDQDNSSWTLSDFVTTGEVLKIPKAGSSSYFVVENHQKLHKYDQIMTGGSLGGLFDSTTTLGEGLYVWSIKNGGSYPPDVKVYTPNGNWNWSLVGTINVGGGWPEVMPLSGRAAVNRNSGKSDRDPQNIQYNGAWWEKWHDTIPLTKVLEIRRNVMGLEEHAWNFDYTRIFSPWSSPSTYLDGTTNLAMQITGESSNDITVKVCITENSCLALPPSKPQWLKITVNENYNPVLTWERNIEPTMKYTGQYKIFRCGTTGGEPSNFTHVATIDAFDEKEPITTWTDPNMFVGQGPDKLFYKISAVDNSAQESMKSDYDWIAYDHTAQKIVTKTGFEIDYGLNQNYPNPFNPVTNIHFTVKDAGRVQIKVYDILGNEIRTLLDQFRDIGSYTVRLDASDLTSGIYIYTIKVNDYVQSRKMTLLK